MDDGNKESAKELLSTFRTLFSIAVSGIFLVVTLRIKNEISICSDAIFKIGIVCGILSLLAMMYLFFLVIPKLYNSIEGIIYKKDVWIVATFSIATFAIGYGSILYSVNCH